MQAKSTTPEGFASKGVKPENLPAIAYKLRGVIADSGVVSLQPFVAVVAIGFQNRRHDCHRSNPQAEARCPCRVSHMIHASAPAERPIRRPAGVASAGCRT